MTNNFGGTKAKEAADNAIKVLRTLHRCEYGCTWEYFEDLEYIRDLLHGGDWEDMLTWMREELKKQEIIINHIIVRRIKRDIETIKTFLNQRAKPDEHI